MSVFEISFFCFLGVGVFSLIVVFASFANNRLYCFLFDHKEWKLWRKYIKDYKSFKFEREFDGVPIFKNDSGVQVYVWETGLCSIHEEDNRCVLCTFNKHHSKKMAKLLTDTIYGEEK